MQRCHYFVKETVKTTHSQTKMPASQSQSQSQQTKAVSSAPVAPLAAAATYFRDLFKERERSEFDLCYYETRKVALCAHLLKTK